MIIPPNPDFYLYDYKRIERTGSRKINDSDSLYNIF